MSKSHEKKGSSVLSVKKTKSSKKDSHTKSVNEVKPSNNDFAVHFINELMIKGVAVPKIFIENNKQIEEGSSELPAVTLAYEIDGVGLRLVMLKWNQINLGMMEALSNTLKNFASLKELKLEFCQLTDEHLYTVQKILQENRNIVYLSLNGNPTTLQNYFLALQGTSLKYLSLQHCNIDYVGVETLTDELKDNGTQTLLSLNLADNNMGNDGLKHLSDTLRGNRTLMALNVADNKIKEDGLVYFFHALQRFTLRHEEIVLRRHWIMDYLIKKIDWLKTNRLSTTAISNKKNSSELLKRKKSHSSETSVKKSSSATKPTTTAGITLRDEADLEKLLKKSQHPFVTSSQPENKEIVCTGNNTLQHLNIAYNTITEKVLKTIIMTLRYQKMTFFNVSKEPMGLSRIIVEGKDVEKYPNLLEEMYSSMSMIQKTSSMRSNLINKRPSTARSYY